jgi:hypothetical protein
MATLDGSTLLSSITEDERSKAMVDGIGRWLRDAGSVAHATRRENFDSFPGDRLGNSQGLRNRLQKMLGVELPRS